MIFAVQFIAEGRKRCHSIQKNRGLVKCLNSHTNDGLKGGTLGSLIIESWADDCTISVATKNNKTVLVVVESNPKMLSPSHFILVFLFR